MAEVDPLAPEISGPVFWLAIHRLADTVERALNRNDDADEKIFSSEALRQKATQRTEFYRALFYLGRMMPCESCRQHFVLNCRYMMLLASRCAKLATLDAMTLRQRDNTYAHMLINAASMTDEVKRDALASMTDRPAFLSMNLVDQNSEHMSDEANAFVAAMKGFDARIVAYALHEHVRLTKHPITVARNFPFLDAANAMLMLDRPNLESALASCAIFCMTAISVRRGPGAVRADRDSLVTALTGLNVPHAPAFMQLLTSNRDSIEAIRRTVGLQDNTPRLLAIAESMNRLRRV